MEFFLPEANSSISRKAPEDVRIEDLRAEPYPDGCRVRVALELTPFQQPPAIELILMNETGEEVASASIVEPVAWKLELTLHIRHSEPTLGSYSLAARVIYPEMEDVDQRTLSFTLAGE
jgi:hypothetical protein